MAEFLEYGKDVLYLAFKGAWAIATAISFIIAIIGGIVSYKYPRRESIVKKLLWQIPLGVFVICLVVNIAFVTPYRIYRNQQQKIDGLEKSLIVAQKQNSNQKDSYEQPLLTGTATIVVGLEPNTASLPRYPDGHLIFMQGQKVLLGMRVSPDSVCTQIVNNQTFCNATFELDQTGKFVGNPISYLAKTDFIKIRLNIIPANSAIVDGYAIFVFNNSVRIKIPITSQTMEGNVIVIQDVQKYLKF